ncbi:MAG TPA: adenylate/guanylate cyclase domain-containing protein [Candidatus Binataceae bacterium]|nr:adenylate/guanylate cyclase domain-containing protein [Candidatus Binataceae bacterium]
MGRSRRIYWASRPQQKTLHCGSEKRALDYLKKAIARRLSHRYEKLLESTRINLHRPRRRVEPGRVLATILFVDIVRSTEKAALLGDRRWNGVLSHYYAAIRRELRASRGREIITTGDGILASFDGEPGAARAIRCAAAIRQGVRTLGLEIRMGLHTGECEVVGEAIGGIAVHIGARIMARAGADELLVSSAVKDLVTGSEINFKDRGTHRLRGVPETWRLYRVLED